MKYTGRYSPSEDDFDIDHVINENEKILKKQISEIDTGNSNCLFAQKVNKLKTLITMLDTITEDVKALNI